MELRLDPASLMRGQPLEIKADGAGQIEGFASIYGEPDSYGDIVQPGAFASSLAAHNKAGTSPLMLWSHDVTKPIGRWTDFNETSGGLVARGSLNLKASAGRDAYEHIRAGDIAGLSIGFNVHEKGAEIDDKGRRILNSLELHEISVVAIPAARRARISEIKSAGQIHELFRSHGLSDRAARKMAQSAFAALEGRDPVELELEAKAAAEQDQLKHVARLLRRHTKRK